jgi:hypothetical protein
MNASINDSHNLGETVASMIIYILTALFSLEACPCHSRIGRYFSPNNCEFRDFAVVSADTEYSIDS